MSGFQFKQFYVEHAGCAMKVGTDGTLLGAWCPLPCIEPPAENAVKTPSPRKLDILDIGTGSGLIALMLAQRCPEARIDAIDIDSDAASQANANFSRSPWSDRLHAEHTSLQQYAEQHAERYHLVVSNPPYFQDSLKNPDAQRTMARHTDTLSYEELIGHAAAILRPDGLLALVAPAEVEPRLLRLMARERLGVKQVTRFYTSSKPGRAAKRVLIAAKKGGQQEVPTYENLYLGSDEYKALVRAFYLYD